MYALRAAFEAQYAGIVTAGIRASRVPVTTNAVGNGFDNKCGRNLIDRSTRREKFVLISSWNASKSTSEGFESRI